MEDLMRCWTLAIVVSCLAIVGCGSEPEPFGQGTLALQWEVAPLGCNSAGVEQVEIVLENELRSYHEHVDCEQGILILSDLIPGTYEVSLQGREDAGRVTFSAVVEDLLVRPDIETRPGVVDLVAIPGQAAVKWQFESQRACDANLVEDVEITVFDASYHQVHRSISPCGAGLAQVSGLYSGTYMFRLRAQGPHEFYEGFIETKITRGEEIGVDIELIRVGAQ